MRRHPLLIRGQMGGLLLLAAAAAAATATTAAAATAAAAAAAAGQINDGSDAFKLLAMHFVLCIISLPWFQHN